MKKSIITVLLVISTISLAGCSNKDSNNNSELQYNHPTFTLNSSTIKKEEYKELEIQKNKDDNNKEQETYIPEHEDIGIGEIILENNDNSVDYKIIDNKDILYKNTTFVDLYVTLSNIESKYDINNLINFIIKTYNVDVNTIYSRYEKDDVESYNSEYITIDEQLSEYDNYIQIKNNYNGSPANWKITLMDANRGHRAIICGCYDYILIMGMDYDLTIDMEEFNLEESKGEESIDETAIEEEENNEDIENSINNNDDEQLHDSLQ